MLALPAAAGSVTGLLLIMPTRCAWLAITAALLVRGQLAIASPALLA